MQVLPCTLCSFFRSPNAPTSQCSLCCSWKFIQNANELRKCVNNIQRNTQMSWKEMKSSTFQYSRVLNSWNDEKHTNGVVHGADNVTFCSLFAKPMNFSHFTGILWLNMQTLNVSCTCFLYITYHFHGIVCVCWKSSKRIVNAKVAHSGKSACIFITH